MRGSAQDRFARHSVANPDAILARAPHSRQSPEASHRPLRLDSDYSFLTRAGISEAALSGAEAEARRSGTAIHDVLICSGKISHMAYASALANRLGVPLAGWDATFEPGNETGERGLAARIGGKTYHVLCAEDAAPSTLGERAAQLQARGLNIALASRPRLDAAQAKLLEAERLDHAVWHLARQQPAFSAAGAIWIWQVIAAAVVVGLIAGGFSVLPDATLAAVSGVIAIPFLCVTLLRVIALREVLSSHPSGAHRQKWADEGLSQTLPLYTIMVPLFRETKVLPGLVQALQALLYPKAKLEILLILESIDIETQAAVLAMRLPANFRIVIVPDQAPRTKPKALNYALQFARGDYIVVYDAEDRPEPDQLLCALAAFDRGPPQLGCVQAQLNIYNPHSSWLTRQFTIEYSALFDAILPALARLGFPVPLGGTSNHFRRDTLLATGGWDPFNVTEDADLGFRMARRGLRTTVLASTTWEEAPATLGQWIRQRTRWIKGWVQTYLVHTRRPWRLTVELGLWGTLGFHALMGALILSALVHPWFYILLGCHALGGALFVPSDTFAGMAFWAVAGFNLAVGYLASVLIGAVSVWRRRRRNLAVAALLMPVMWLLMSLASYRALYQLFRDPYLWEKTEHGVGPRR